MSQRSKVLQLQPDYNVKAHDFADLAEQIVKALPSDRYEVTAAFLRGKPAPGGGVTKKLPPTRSTRRYCATRIRKILRNQY